MDYKLMWNKLKETIEEVEQEGGKSEEWLKVISIKDLKIAMKVIEQMVKKVESEVSNND